MSQYLVLAKSEVTARAIGLWLPRLGQEPLAAKMGHDRRVILWNREQAINPESGAVDFERLVSQIETIAEASGSIQLNALTILVDCIRPEYLNPNSEQGTWENIISMLILSFPEVRWCFGHIEKPLSGFPDMHISTLIGKPRADPLLDPDGLREWIRDKISQDVKVDWIPKRKHLAAVIEEERIYAYFHGYTAYRFGLRTHLITSFALMDRFKGKENDGPEYELLMEDMSLGFADRPQEISLICLKERDDRYQKLKNTNVRALITSGQSSSDNILQKNREYLETDVVKKGVVKKGCVIYKPAGGMLDLWQRLGYLNKKQETGRKGNVEGFIWPPHETTSQHHNPTNKGHSAPGKLALIAQTLIKRAEKIQQAQGRIEHQIAAAVMATDASEYLGGRSPTTATEALFLKYMLELRASCHFVGFEFHIKMEHRRSELQVESEAICRWYAKPLRRRADLNLRMHVANGFVRLLREENQFDEEQYWSTISRHLHNTLWIEDQEWRQLFRPILRYSEFLLHSMSRFLLSVVVWILFFTLILTVGTLASPDSTYSSSFADTSDYGPFTQAIFSFLSGEGPAYHSPFWVFITTLCSILGLAHLGVFISHLYSIMSRK